jgi:hypothetical protein
MELPERGKKMKRILRTVCMVWVFIAVSLLAVPAQAAWWEFGRSDGEPVITDLKFNQIDVTRAEDTVVLTREDLQGGVLTLRGRAEVRRGLIGLVEYSMDGGQKWIRSTVDERGAFTTDLRLDMERDYDFKVRAMSTTGQKTDEENHSFRLKVTAANPQDAVRQAFTQLLQAYMQENRSAFMRLVAKDFDGNEAALEDAITDDFRYLDNILIEPQISRVAQFDKQYEIYFNFNRRVTSTQSGKTLRDSASSTVSFVREGEGFKLSRMAAPLIFGLSGASEVASSVTAQAVGTTVISIDGKTGAASTGAQGSTLPMDVVTGRGTLITQHSTSGGAPTCDSFAFETDDKTPNQVCFGAFPGDISFSYGGVTLQAGVYAQKLTTSFDTTSLAPETINGSNINNPSSGDVYALKLLSGKYVIFEISSISQGTLNPALNFRYKYQPSGSRNF